MREVPKDHGREQERSGSAEESIRGHERRIQKKELKPAKHGGDEANKGEKTKDALETVNSNESGNRSEEANSVLMFDSETANQLKAKRKKMQQNKRQHSKGVEKGRTSRQADRKGQGVRNQSRSASDA